MRKLLFPCCSLQLGRLVCDSECIEDMTEISCHDDGEIREVLIDPMIRESILWEVVGTDFLTAIPCSDESETSRSFFFGFFLFFHSEYTRLEY